MKKIIPSNAVDYWKNRILESEKIAQDIAGKYHKKELAYYKSAFKKIEQGIDSLFAQIYTDGIDTVTRSQLWQYKRWIELRNEIATSVSGIAPQEINLIDNAIEEVFDRTIGNFSQFGGFTSTGKAFAETYLNENWSGQHYSQRVWGNNAELAARLEKKISDMVVIGKMPDEIKKELINEFGVSYYKADRLIRTEASYAFNQSSLNRYAAMGASKVEFYAEADCCDQCAEYSGQQFNLNDAPMIPLHPFAAAAIFQQQGSIAAKIDSITTKIFTSTKYRNLWSGFIKYPLNYRGKPTK